MKRYLFIINSKAGNHKTAKKTISQVCETLSAVSINYELAYTKKNGHASELAREAAKKGFTVVVAVGGDGTINEVAKGLAGSDIIMGIIPMGSGNGLARHLNISSNPQKAINTVLKGNIGRVDLWKMNEHFFLSVGGNGFDAQIAHEMSNSKRRGKWAYVKHVLKKCQSYKPIHIELSIGDLQIKQDAFMVTFANSSQFGNNAYISPDAKIDDGLLDIICIKPIYKIMYPVLGLAVFSKILNWFPFHQKYQGNSIIIHSTSSGLFHIDGEALELKTPVKISSFGQPLKVCVP